MLENARMHCHVPAHEARYDVVTEHGARAAHVITGMQQVESSKVGVVHCVMRAHI